MFAKTDDQQSTCLSPLTYSVLPGFHNATLSRTPRVSTLGLENTIGSVKTSFYHTMIPSALGLITQPNGVSKSEFTLYIVELCTCFHPREALHYPQTMLAVHGRCFPAALGTLTPHSYFLSELFTQDTEAKIPGI